MQITIIPWIRAQRHKSRLFWARQPPVSLGLTPSVPQQPTTATLSLHDTSQAHGLYDDGPAVLNERGLPRSAQDMADAEQRSSSSVFQRAESVAHVSKKHCAEGPMTQAL